MLKLFGGFIAILLAVPALQAQGLSRVYTEPAVPNADVLDRLNLKLAWYAYVPTDRKRDGVHSIAVLDDQIIVQTRSGAIVALEAATGAIQWRTVVGQANIAPIGFGMNSRSVFVAKGVRLFALDRTTGVVEWSYYLPHAPSAGPTADEDRIYVPLGTGSLYAYDLPKPGVPQPGLVASPIVRKTEDAGPSSAGTASGGEKLSPSPAMGRAIGGGAPQGATGRGPSSISAVNSGRALSSISAVNSGSRAIRAIGALEHSAKNLRAIGALGSGLQEEHEQSGPQPSPIWEYLAETRLEIAPLLSSDYLLLAGYSGSFYAMSKYDGKTLYRFQAGPPLTAPIGSHSGIAYVASEDYTVYALDSSAGKILWRFAGGGPILQKPRATDNYVFVNPERAGMYCLDRATGETLWRNMDALSYLSMNNKFVYAMDRNNRLLILDIGTGRQLATWDGSRDYVVPLSNERTDRVFLGSNNGLIVCLYDRDFPKATLIAHDVEPKAGLPTAKPAGGIERKSGRPQAPEKPGEPKDQAP